MYFLMKSNWWEVNIGLGYGLVPLGTKPLPQPVLTNICDAIRPHWVN